MLSEEKIRLMISLSDFESGQGKKDLYRMKYYKGDYIRFQILKTVISVTISMVLLIGLAALYKAEYLLVHMVSLDYAKIIGVLVLVYLLVLLLSVAFTFHVSAHRYKRAYKRVKRYRNTLKELQKYYEEEENDVNSIRTEG